VEVGVLAEALEHLEALGNRGGTGRFARVFVGLGEGWLAPRGTQATAEDVEAHLDAVSATEPFSVPTSIVDEVLEICARVGISL
jgi:hypothetical protein